MDLAVVACSTMDQITKNHAQWILHTKAAIRNIPLRNKYRNTMIEIIPSVLVQSEEEFVQNISGLENSVDMIQLDIADGVFVDNTTWADPEKVKKIPLEIELHLMVQNPLEELQRWQGVHQVKRVHFHFESTESVDTTIAEIREAGYEVGVALKPETSIEVLEPYINEIDAVLFLSVHPGKQGQPFLPEVLEKIQSFRKKGWNHFVEIDGGVNEKTLPEIIASGVDAVCPGSAIFKEGNPAENVQKMEKLLANTH